MAESTGWRVVETQSLEWWSQLEGISKGSPHFSKWQNNPGPAKADEMFKLDNVRVRLGTESGTS